MANHRAPAPTRPPRLWLALMGAACAGILLPPVVIALQPVAPRPVAERLSLTPERATEPMGHGGLGGALSVPTVGVIAEETAAGLPPIVRSSRPPQRPQEALEPTLRVTPTSETTPEAVREAYTAIPEPSETTDPAPSDAEPAETAAATETTTAETAAATTTEATQTTTETTRPTVTETPRRFDDPFEDGRSWWAR